MLVSYWTKRLGLGKTCDLDLHWVRRRIAVCGLLGLLSSALVTSASAANYYFSSSVGNDSWSGSLQNPNGANTDGPKRSLAALQTLMNDVAAPGDMVHLRAGDTWTSANSLVLNAVVGTATQPITMRRYGTGAAPLLQQNGAATMLVIRGSDQPTRFLTIEGIQLESVTPPGDRGGGVAVLETIFVKPRDIVLRDVEVRNFPQGINIQTDAVTLERCVLRGNKLLAPEPVGNASTGLFAAGSDIVVADSVFDDNGGTASFFVWNAYFSNGARIRFERNQIRLGNGGLKLRGVTDALITDNRIEAIAITAMAFGADAGAASFANVSNVTIERNRISGSAEGLVLREQSGIAGSSSLSDVRIRNNLIGADTVNASISALLLVDGNQTINNVEIAHNALWSTQRNAITVAHPGPNQLQIRNNVLHASTGVHLRSNASLSSAINLLDGNLYAGTAAAGQSAATVLPTLAALRTAFPSFETAGLAGAANLVNAPIDLRPTSASTLIVDRALPSSLLTDIDQRVRPFDGDNNASAISDIGAYEFGALEPVVFRNGFE